MKSEKYFKCLGCRNLKVEIDVVSLPKADRNRYKRKGFMLWFNSTHGKFWIRNSFCPENESEFVDVVEKCLRCPFYIGVFVRRKLCLDCNLRIDVYHKSEIRYPESLSEFLQLYDKVKGRIDG
ncbi:MAG: hypothetical protein ACTSYM_05850 [Candidatus Baldrarchaeia archaeon]